MVGAGAEYGTAGPEQADEEDKGDHHEVAWGQGPAGAAEAVG